MSHKAIVGIDIGATKIAIALATREGRIIASHRLATEAERGPDVILDEMILGITGLCAEACVTPLLIGVGCPGPLDRESGVIKSPVNLPGWDDFPLIARLQERLNAPAVLDNDANIAALGEHVHGAGRGLSDFFYMTVSSGVGGAVIVNNKLLRGVAAGAGELGHYTVDPDGPLCGCGARGCLDVLSSGTAIVRRARERLAKSNGHTSDVSLLAAQSVLTAKDVIDAAKKGDRLALEIWAETIEYLSLGLSAVIGLLAPQAIIVGGGVTQCGAFLLDPLRAKVSKRIGNIPTGLIRIEQAALGTSSGMYGALELARLAVDD